MGHPENINWSPDRHRPQLLDSPFGARKTAPQFTQLSVDPSQGLTRKRYAYYSNGTMFDDALFTPVEAGIRLETSPTGTDEARLRSAYPGQYISQSVAQPGLGIVVDADNVAIADDGSVSLTHGELYVGAFYWDSATGEPDTGLGFVWDTDGWRFFVKSLGEHIGASPNEQSDFGIDTGDGKGHSGLVVDPSDGYVWNFPHTWYNEGPLSGAFLNPRTNHIEEIVRVAIEGRPSTETPNLPVQAVARNAGTAEPLGVEVGGLQYSTYGAGRDDLERRSTPETRIQDDYITETVAFTENAVNPAAEPGSPIVAAQRDATGRDLNLRATEIEIQPTPGNIWVYEWDEYDPETALDGEFTEPVSPNNETEETQLLTNTTATTYTPTEAVLRSMRYYEGGQDQKIAPTTADTDLRVPLEATRVFTAALAPGSNSTGTNPFRVIFEEGY